MSFPTSTGAIQPKITVVGSGLAGLTAAFRLQEMGYHVNLYEARQRPGGRVLTAKLGESYEELGGKNFLDGSTAENSLKLIYDLGLKILEDERPYSRVFVNGNQMIPFLDILRKLRDPEALEIKLAEIAARSQNLQEVIDSVFEDPNLRLLSTVIMASYEGSDPKNLDSSCFDALYWLFMHGIIAIRKADEGQNPTVKWLTLKGGNAQLPLALSEKLSTPIHYDHALTALRKENQKIVLTFNHKKEISTDLVLLAIPCSTFEDIDFGLNAIPPEQLSRIQEVQYGTNGKILFPIAIENPLYDVVLSSDVCSWMNHSNKVMTFYYGGTRSIFNAQNAKSKFDQGILTIKAVYPSLTIKANTLEEANDRQLAPYDNAVFKSWVADPYSKGSYSNRAPGTATWLSEMENRNGEKVRKAFRPVKNKIFFAGEHTTILDALGTLEGAIESGERMARLMNKVLRK